MTKDSDLLNDTASAEDQVTLELLLEAARRANWDALHGPRHLRSGRYFIAVKQTVSFPRMFAPQGIEAETAPAFSSMVRQSAG